MGSNYRKALVAFCMTTMFSGALISECFADNGSGGKVVVKGKITGWVSRSKESGAITANGPISSGALVNFPANSTISSGNNLGFELSGSYFLTDNIAAEASAGITNKKIKAKGNESQAAAPVDTTSHQYIAYSVSTIGKFIPLSLIFQYHIAPYGKISPYIGLGYHYTLASGSSGSRIGTSYGPVMQAGFDSWVGDDVTLSLEMKKYLMQTKFSMTAPTSSSSGSGGNLTLPTEVIRINPFVVSIALGYRF
jgi:outer membrane protein